MYRRKSNTQPVAQSHYRHPLRSHHRKAPRARRHGVGTIQLILAVPVLFIATLAIFQFGMVMLINQTIVTATIEGTREAARGGNIEDVRAVVNQFLAIHQLEVVDNPMGLARLILDPPNPITEVGNPAIPCSPDGPAPVAGEVRVTLCVRVSQNDEPIPNFLQMFGFSLSDQTYEASSLQLVE